MADSDCDQRTSHQRAQKVSKRLSCIPSIKIHLPQCVDRPADPIVRGPQNAFSKDVVMDSDCGYLIASSQRWVQANGPCSIQPRHDNLGSLTLAFTFYGDFDLQKKVSNFE